MYSTNGIILKKQDIGEADALFTIYTKDFGKIRAVAQGVKKENAKLKGHLEPFSLSTVSFVLGRNSPRLTHAALLNFWPVLRIEEEKLKAAYHIVRTLDQNCFEGERDLRLWELLVQSFSELDSERDAPNGFGALLGSFEEQFVEFLGYGRGHDLQSLKFNP